MDDGTMFGLGQALAEAKSRQDVEAALTFMHPDMVLENAAFGSKAVGIEENRTALTRWFKAFPTTTSSCAATPATGRPSSAGATSG